MTEIMGCPRCPLYLSDSPGEPFKQKESLRVAPSVEGSTRWPALSLQWGSVHGQTTNVCQSLVPERSETFQLPAPSVAALWKRSHALL